MGVTALIEGAGRMMKEGEQCSGRWKEGSRVGNGRGGVKVKWNEQEASV